MNIHKLTGGACYFEGVTNLGLLVKDNAALLVDSGLDAFTAKKVTKILREQNIILNGLILTHAHADHAGGAAYLRETWQVPVMASALEKPFIENPQFEPFYLYGGSHPLKELENKFLQAPPCPVDISLSPGCQEIAGFPLEIAALPGHTPGQIGVVYDDAFYTADALFSPAVLVKHGIPYFVDIALSLQTMEYLASGMTRSHYFIPAHGSANMDITSLAAANKKYLQDIAGMVFDALTTPLTTAGLLARICQKSGLVMKSPGQYYLNKAGLKSFLSYLSNSQRIKAILEDNVLLWTRHQDSPE